LQVPYQITLSEQQRVLSRADLLTCGADAALLKAVYGQGEPLAEVARLRQERAGKVTRRVAALSRRLLSAEVEFVLRVRESLAGQRRQIATMCFVHGRSMRSVAEEQGLSFYAVRRHCEALRAMMDAERGVGAVGVKAALGGAA
jgi:hypothetical protein